MNDNSYVVLICDLSIYRHLPMSINRQKLHEVLHFTATQPSPWLSSLMWAFTKCSVFPVHTKKPNQCFKMYSCWRLWRGFWVRNNPSLLWMESWNWEKNVCFVVFYLTSSMLMNSKIACPLGCPELSIFILWEISYIFGLYTYVLAFIHPKIPLLFWRHYPYF